MCPEGEYLSADGTKTNKGFIHGRKQKAWRNTWAKKVAYLHVKVDEAGNCWAKLFDTMQDEDNRATIPHFPEKGEPPAAQIGFSVSARV